MSSQIVGLFVEQYIGKECYGSNCDFEYKDEPMTRYHFMLVYSDNKKYILTLERISGECGSGWCCASWVNPTIKEVKKFPPFNYIPKKSLFVDFEYTSTNKCPYVFESKIFSYDHDGDDSYYPHGSMQINLEYFEELKRSPKNNQRPVWIVFGHSGLGKSYLFNNIKSNSSLTVFETDGYNHLPKQINDNIIIIGNKHRYKIEHIITRLSKNSKIIYVGFSDKI